MYSSYDIDEALSKVELGELCQAEVVHEYGIPRWTLYRKKEGENYPILNQNFFNLYKEAGEVLIWWHIRSAILGGIDRAISGRIGTRVQYTATDIIQKNKEEKLTVEEKRLGPATVLVANTEEYLVHWELSMQKQGRSVESEMILHKAR